jgi:hypothetical protein
VEDGTNEHGDPLLRFEESFTPRLADGVSLRLKKYELWGPSTADNETPRSTDVDKAPAESGPGD